MYLFSLREGFNFMKREGNIFLAFLFLFAFIVVGYAFANIKVIKRSTDWATGKINISKDKYNVIVVGSDPEGIAAAVAAARSGAKTLLLGKEDAPGGLLTYGMLNTLDMNYNDVEQLVTRGIFYEFYTAIGKTESFDVERAKKIFTDMIEKEKMLVYKPNYSFSEAILNENTIIGVKMVSQSGEIEEFYGDRVIDATQDGDVCALAGVPYYTGMEDVHWPYKMAATLVFRVKGVDWKVLEEDIENYKKITKDTGCGYNKSSVWGFGKWCYDLYKPLHSNMQLRGPNMGLQDDGTVLINALQIFNVDSFDEETVKRTIEEGTLEAENAVKHFKKYLKAFENAEFDGTAEQLYIRETRHIRGEYTLQLLDLLEGKNFKTKIAMGSYPVDIQASSRGNKGYVVCAPNQYSIPLECTIPLNIDNLFIVGKSASYSSVAAGSTRVVPVGMVVGESAGVAAVYSIYKETTPRELIKSDSRIRQLLGILKNQNVYLSEFNYTNPNADVKGYNKIRRLINLGFILGGYNNDFGFNNDATIEMYCKTLCNALQFGGNEKYGVVESTKITAFNSTEKLTAVKAARICAVLLDNYVMPERVYRFKDDGTEMTEEELAQAKAFREAKIDNDVWFLAQTNNYFSEDINDKDKILTKREMYVLAVDTVERYIGREIKP